MRIRLTTGRATIDESQRFGDIIDLPEDEAVRLLNDGQATPVDNESPHQRRERRVVVAKETR